MEDLDDQKNMTYGQKKKWSVEAEPEMIQILELSDRSWKLKMINVFKDLVENIQEHTENFSRKIKITKGKMKIKWKI